MRKASEELAKEVKSIGHSVETNAIEDFRLDLYATSNCAQISTKKIVKPFSPFPFV